MSYEEVAAKLDEIEAELRRLGSLEGPIGSPASVRSAFGLEEMPFDQWLSTVLLPNAHKAIKERNLPDVSQVGVIALRNFDGYDEAKTLVRLLSEFDRAVERAARGAGGI